eukprot:symbB.v1.2.031965.t1/scaffold3758.1/size53312/2
MADGSFCTAADVVFRSISLRPFLNHPGLDSRGVAFHKPINLVNSQAHSSSAACPFDADLRKDPPRCNSRQEKLPASRVHRGIRGLRPIPNPSGKSKSESSNVEASMVIGKDGGASHQRRRAETFSEEPEDPRVLVPAHRIGDAPRSRKGEASIGRRSATLNGSGQSTGLKRSQEPMLRPHASLPCLSGKQMKLHLNSEPLQPSPAAKPMAKPVLSNAGLLQFMLPSFGFPATVEEEVALEELFAQMPFMEDEVLGASAESPSQWQDGMEFPY